MGYWYIGSIAAKSGRRLDGEFRTVGCPYDVRVSWALSPGSAQPALNGCSIWPLVFAFLFRRTRMPANKVATPVLTRRLALAGTARSHDARPLAARDRYHPPVNRSLTGLQLRTAELRDDREPIPDL